MKYRKKPVVIDAIQWIGTNRDEVFAFVEDYELEQTRAIRKGADDTLIIKTLEGDMTANKYDWIIEGIKGECYPCKPDIFEATYEAVE